MFYICTKFCQNISKGFRVADSKSSVDARVVVNVDGLKYGRTEGVPTDGKPASYIATCLRQARQR